MCFFFLFASFLFMIHATHTWHGWDTTLQAELDFVFSLCIILGVIVTVSPFVLIAIAPTMYVAWVGLATPVPSCHHV